ncbi:MAG: ABC transporter permease [Spirochaetia bacterium]|nr:ABC transporter permease [Spirochaetia bacterium]
MIVILFDILWVCLAITLVAGLRKFLTAENLKDARRELWNKKRVRIAFFAIAIYLVVGLLSQIKIPGTGKISDPSLLDLAYSGMPKERTYSAPFAAEVTGIKLRKEEYPLNLVKGIHLLGTDINGGDILYAVMQGAGTALILSFGTAAVAFPIGIAFGIISGWFGSKLDDLIQWLMATIASIPWLLFVIAFLMVFGRGIFWICLAIGLTSWVGTARLIRGETMKQKSLDYITAARAAGISTFRILTKHLMPNVRYLIIIDFTLFCSSVILAESILTFIGIGVEQGTASWGAMLVEAEKELMRSPSIWWVFAGSAFVGIFPLVLSLNIVGDALRDALDPRTSSTR